jgi:hypothetical protein
VWGTDVEGGVGGDVEGRGKDWAAVDAGGREEGTDVEGDGDGDEDRDVEDGFDESVAGEVVGEKVNGTWEVAARGWKEQSNMKATAT